MYRQKEYFARESFYLFCDYEKVEYCKNLQLIVIPIKLVIAYIVSTPAIDNLAVAFLCYQSLADHEGCNL